MQGLSALLKNSPNQLLQEIFLSVQHAVLHWRVKNQVHLSIASAQKIVSRSGHGQSYSYHARIRAQGAWPLDWQLSKRLPSMQGHADITQMLLRLHSTSITASNAAMQLTQS